MLLQAALSGLLIFAAAPTTQPARAPAQNYFGAHLLIQSGSGRDLEQLRWARYLVGRWGYAKTLLNPIDARTSGPAKGWVEYVERCHELELVPVLRLAGHFQNGRWEKPEADAPGEYASMAAAVKRVVSGLPRTDACPLYIEVWNEPNIDDEWSGHANAGEYAAFFVQTAQAIRSINDPRIRVLNGALATRPEFMNELCKSTPAFVRAFDLFAAHPYPANLPPHINYHDRTAVAHEKLTVDAHLLEVAVLEKFGRERPAVMLTETGYELGNKVYRSFPIIDEQNRADYMMRLFRDAYPRWPEIIAVMPFTFCASWWERFNWVYPDSQTNPDGSPTRPHAQYVAVAALAKPNDETGAISGTVKPAGLEARIDDVAVVLSSREKKITDRLGNYFFARLRPGRYPLSFSHAGFADAMREVEVKAGQNTVVDVSLAASSTARLTGLILDGESDRPLKGVHVRLVPHIHKESTSGEDGRFVLDDLIPTHYRLIANADGCCRYESQSITLAPNLLTEHGFRLGRQRAPAGSVNLLTNPSFEEGGGAAGRSGLALGFEIVHDGGHMHIDQTRAHTGRCSQAIRLSPREAEIRQVSFYSTVQAGSAYLGSAWVSLDARKGRVWITTSFMTQSGEILKSLDLDNPSPKESPAWSWLSIRGVAPPGSARMSLELHARGDDGIGYFDDVHIGPLPPPATQHE